MTTGVLVLLVLKETVLDPVIEEGLGFVDDPVLVGTVTLEVLLAVEVVLTVLPGARNRKVGLLV